MNALRDAIFAETAASQRRRDVAGMLNGTAHMGAPEQARPLIGRAAAGTEPRDEVRDAVREGCKFAPLRDPCWRCGSRFDLHDQYGCDDWIGYGS